MRTWAPLQDENPAAWYWWVGEVEQFLGVRPSGREQAETAKEACPPSAPLTIDGCQVLRNATPEELKGGPPPACGRFVVVREAGGSEREVIALLWEDSRGALTLETGTDGLTVLGSPAHATWLPEGWRMRHYPTGLALPNLEHWFRCVINDASEDQPFVVGPGLGGPSWPTVRGMVAHAYLIVRHFGFPDSPKEPPQPLDREGYVTNLREVLHFLRLHLASNRHQQAGRARSPAPEAGSVMCDDTPPKPAVSVSVEAPKADERPAVYLLSWRDILDALAMKNNDENRRRVRDLNDRYEGPIIPPEQGGQPKVNKAKLLQWWEDLERQFAAKTQKDIDKQATGDEQYSYGKDGKVVPDIGGHVKKGRRRKPGN